MRKRQGGAIHTVYPSLLA